MGHGHTTPWLVAALQQRRVFDFGVRTARPQLWWAEETSPPTPALCVPGRDISQSHKVRSQSHTLRPQGLFTMQLQKKPEQVSLFGRNPAASLHFSGGQQPPPSPSRVKVLTRPLVQGTSARASLHPKRLHTEDPKLMTAVPPFLVKLSIFCHKGTRNRVQLLVKHEY